jgi:riboflavin synthase
MFTGIIEEVGRIVKMDKSGSILTFTINAPKICKDSKEGDSIAIDGVCLSITEIDKENFKVQAVPETLKRTTLLNFKNNTSVNLERAVKPTDRLGGHILTGHIDGLGKIIKKEGNKTSFTLTIDTPPPLMKYIVPNGSIGIDGISLTIKDVEKSSFKVTIIPYTTSSTTIEEKEINDKVNLETDILAKYVQKITSKEKEPVTIDYLKEKGFL